MSVMPGIVPLPLRLPASAAMAFWPCEEPPSDSPMEDEDRPCRQPGHWLFEFGGRWFETKTIHYQQYLVRRICDFNTEVKQLRRALGHKNQLR